MARRLHRSRRHCLIAGVCGGIAERLGWSPLLVRTLFVLGAVLPIFPGAVAYVVLWLVLPKAEAPASSSRPAETIPGGSDSPEM
jgi:phage shock protein PspC (stress-responsive transcriptional regulator)